MCRKCQKEEKHHELHRKNTRAVRAAVHRYAARPCRMRRRTNEPAADSQTFTNETGSVTDKSEHEPLTVMYNIGLDEFIDVVHEKYPEINFEQIAYNGGNRSWYSPSQMITGEIPDLLTRQPRG